MNQTQLSDFTFPFHFHALERELATHSSVLAWRIPGTGKPGGLPSRLWGCRVGHDLSDLAAAAAVLHGRFSLVIYFIHRSVSFGEENGNPFQYFAWRIPRTE